MGARRKDPPSQMQDGAPSRPSIVRRPHALGEEKIDHAHVQRHPHTDGDTRHPDRLGDRMTVDLAANEQPLATGSRVELTKHLYGHVAGAQGAVVRTAVRGQTKVLIRFDDTGYEIAVPPAALKPLA